MRNRRIFILIESLFKILRFNSMFSTVPPESEIIVIMERHKIYLKFYLYLYKNFQNKNQLECEKILFKTQISRKLSKKRTKIMKENNKKLNMQMFEFIERILRAK